MSDELIKQVKRKLNITWSEEDTENRVNDIIQSAIPIVKDKIGIAEDVDFDFSIPGKENLLFKNYCLYEYNHCANEFDDNYSNDIAQLRAKYEVKSYQSEVTTDE